MDSPDIQAQPEGELSLRTIAMPKDTNANGSIFGGWVMSQMDLAGALHAGVASQGRVATVAVDSMKFVQPIFVGDEVSCYTSITRVGTTSISIHVEVWVRRHRLGEPILVTHGTYVFVSLDDDMRPKPLDKERLNLA